MLIKGVGAESANSAEEEYMAVRACLESMPKAPDGYCYHLNENLEWVLCEKPVVEFGDLAEEFDFSEATIDDYQNALREVGVEV